MTPEKVMIVFQEAIKITCMLSAPLLLSVLCIGLIISFFQAATQINEQTLSFIPKLICILIIFIFFGPWMLRIMLNYIEFIFTNIAEKNL
ncbi:flagellar biosynthesis protein FliQ [Buchnera aphidicola]|uniref:Flagellar biosynthetic protein FliQ n=1 Tax=Buchnera aphidicola (Anoecia oenotherae) TaxID=1241833 RepID=A0A4D6Y442_9GAMM|nr:flagellar biosynthesis protein FliQ [Buchnera aphidicola]QCI19205.1 flagellar biosynthetic protein FliQ [Buchnera aphidicola (Anoecia oenotherae)]